MTKLTIALTTISCALITLGANAQENYQDMHKQLNIMNNIITSSVGDQGSNSAGRINNVDSFYLHDQGVVFTISTNSNGNRWGNYNFNFAMPAIAPIAPVAPVSKMPPSHVQMNFDREIEVSVENAMAMASSCCAAGTSIRVGALQLWPVLFITCRTPRLTAFSSASAKTIFAPLPPINVSRPVDASVSPGAGTWGTAYTTSSLIDPRFQMLNEPPPFPIAEPY